MNSDIKEHNDVSPPHGLSSAESASFNDLLCVFDEALEYMPYLQFELGYTRTTDWMIHIYNSAGGNSVKVLTGQEVTREDVCRFAAISLRRYFAEKTGRNI